MGISDRFGRRADSTSRISKVSAVCLDRGTLISVGIAVPLVGALTAIVLAVSGSAQAAGQPGPDVRPFGAMPTVTTTVTITPPPADGYQFVQLGSRKDRTFNELLGINNNGRIAGYYGSGNGGHPSRGYTIIAPYAQGNIKSENFPGAAQTEVEGLNDHNVQVGLYSTQNKTTFTEDNYFGWYFNGKFHKVTYPTKDNHNPPFNELAAVNNHDIAVGFYESKSGRDRGYTLNIKTGKFALVTKPGAPSGGNAPSLSALGINNAGDIVGDYTATGGTIDGFIKLAGGAFHTIAVPGATETAAFGINDNDTVVGAYIDDTSGTETIHGFIWRIGGTLLTNIDDPNADNVSIINGINNEGDIVGFYEDSLGRFDGFLAYPAF